MIDSLPESLMSLRCGLRASEENSQAEFHLSRGIRLACDYAEAGRTIDIQRRIGRLKVVQHVDELEAQRRAHAFPDADVFIDRQVQVPGREAAQDSVASALAVDSKNPAPEIRINRGRVSEYVNS